MKRFKSYIIEKDLNEFEEDCLLNETKKEKEMKSFKQHIKEAHYEGDAQGVGTTDNQNSVEDSHIGAHNIDHPDVLNKINAFVGSIADREYLVPLHAVAELKEKLSRLGLTFDGNVTLPESGSGSVVVNLKQFGGRYGKDTDSKPDEVINDDGISHRKEGGLKLEFNFEKLNNNSSKVYAKLI
jgi:hypothetical protein